MSHFTPEEEKWMKKMQRALNSCPFPQRLGFYTIGDKEITVYDLDKKDEIEDFYNNNDRDFCTCVDDADAQLGVLKFPALVHSTAG